MDGRRTCVALGALVNSKARAVEEEMYVEMIQQLSAKRLPSLV